VFQQYLATTRVPAFEYRLDGTTLSYRWADVVPRFHMPLRVALDGRTYSTLLPTEAWQTAPSPVSDASVVRVDENFYVITRNLTAPNGRQ
jgi:hypothetical protein